MRNLLRFVKWWLEIVRICWECCIESQQIKIEILPKTSYLPNSVFIWSWRLQDSMKLLFRPCSGTKCPPRSNHKKEPHLIVAWILYENILSSPTNRLTSSLKVYEPSKVYDVAAQHQHVIKRSSCFAATQNFRKTWCQKRFLGRMHKISPHETYQLNLDHP